MRTTITLDADTAALVERLMRERGMSFKAAVNHAIREGLAPRAGRGSFRTPTFSMGFDERVPLDKALRLAAELEDEELARRLDAHR